MDTDFINLTPENLSSEHLCCIIRSKKIHPGIEAKRQWLASRLTEGHVFRKLNAKAKELPCVFNNWAVFYNGNFVTVNLFLDVSYIEKIVNRYATT